MVEAERRELAALLAGTRTGASLLTPQPRTAVSSTDDVKWIERELNITSKFTGIIRHLETVVAEQNLLIAKLQAGKQ